MTNPTLVEEAVEQFSLFVRGYDDFPDDYVVTGVGHGELTIGTCRTLLAALPTDDDVTEAMTIAGAKEMRGHFLVNSVEYTVNRVYKAMRSAAIHTLIGRAG